MHTRVILLALSATLVAAPGWAARSNAERDHDTYREQLMSNQVPPYVFPAQFKEDINTLPATGAGPGTKSMPTPDTSTETQPTITDEPAPVEPAPQPQ